MFTATLIARALGKPRQAVLRSLSDVAPSGQVIIQGKPVNAWLQTALPAHTQEELKLAAQRHGHKTIWEPKIPLGDISQTCINAATKLREVLRQVMERRSTGTAPVYELEAEAAGNYGRVFGKVSLRYIRKLIRRTEDRAGGACDWNRLELYLADRLERKTELAAQPKEFPALAQYINACSRPPTKIEERGIWTLAFEQYQNLLRDGDSPKRAARKIRTYLFENAPFLSASRDALLKAFDRNLGAFLEKGPNGLRDGREQNGAGFELPQDDRDTLIHRAVFYYRGDVAPAWRDLLRSGFSEAVRGRYAGKADSKSHMPTSIRESVAPEVEIMTVMHQGPRAFDQIKGHVDRSYEGIASLKCMVADDFTMPVYFYVPDGKGWFNLTRGQILIFIDFRTLCVLGWSLQPDRNYSSLTIRSLCTHVFGEHGVPSVLQFERGIWESSTLLKGREKAALGFAEVAQGLKEFGIRFIHSIRARSKTVERVGGLIQDLMEAEPGYCGRDERRDAPETLRKQMAAVGGRQAGSLDKFYSYEQWNERFGQIVNQYNAIAQQGRILQDISPEAALLKFADPSDPPMQFTSAVRYLLAHDKRPERVTLNGITIRIGKKKFNYRGREIAHLVGREVLAWFDPENPDTIVVTNMNRENPICVARSLEPSALECVANAESETLARELSRIEEQASYIKARYNVVKAKGQMPRRPIVFTDARPVELGAEIAAQRSKLQVEQRETEKVRRVSRKLNMALPESAVRRPGAASDLQKLAELLNEED